MDRLRSQNALQGIASRFRRVPLGVLATALIGACYLGMTAAALAAGPEPYAVALGNLVNEYRQQHGLAPLVADPRLAMLADGHSVDMAGAHRMSHDGFQARMQKTGYKMCVENVGWNYPGVREQFEGWKESPGHDHNLRDARVTRMGIGMSASYVTFIACR